MTSGRYLEGILFAALVLVPVAAAVHVWRGRLLPGWSGAPAYLAEIVMALAVVICVSELLGAVRLFRIAATVPVLACVGIAGWYFGVRNSGKLIGAHETQEFVEQRPRPSQPGAILVAIVAVSILAAGWGTRTVGAFHHGMTTTDTLWYHMPFAARFVQQGTITPLHYVDSGAVTVFFPASSELIHALGIMFMGSDLLSPLINSVWGAVALLAAWCIGRPFGVAPTTLTGVAMLLATPGLVATQPGSAYDDTAGLAMLLSCAALLITASNAGGRMIGQGVAALAAGLALGIKFTLIAPVGALTVGIWILAGRGRRLAEGSTWLFLVVVTGGFWYLRNLIAVGNPLPSLHVKLGPLALPSPATGTPTSTVAQFLFNGNAWRQYFLPGLRLSFGPAWWALLALSAAGLVIGLAAGPGRTVRMLAWVGLASAAAFLVTPQYLAILGVPVFFVDNVRYGDPAWVLGLVLLPLIPILRIGASSWWVLGSYLGILAVTQLDGTIWPIDVLSQRFGFPIGGIDSVIGLLCGVVVLSVGLVLWRLRRGRPMWRPSALVGVVLIVALLASGLGLQRFYLRNRYTNSNPLAIGSWAQNISKARIAVAGGFSQLQYEFYGRDLTNYVQYLGQPEPHGGYAPITNCEQWRELLNHGHYDYVVTSTGIVAHREDVIDHPPTYSLWTITDPASTLVQRDIMAVPDTGAYIGLFLYRLRGPLDPASCATSGVKQDAEMDLTANYSSERAAVRSSSGSSAYRINRVR